MLSSRGMGDIDPSKVPKGKRVVRKNGPKKAEPTQQDKKVNLPSWMQAKRNK